MPQKIMLAVDCRPAAYRLGTDRTKHRMSLAFQFPLNLWLIPLCAFCICWLTLAALMQRAARLPMDHPNDRSLHVTPTPRFGGIGIMAGVLAATLLIQSSALLYIILGAAALAAISLLDDFKNLPVSWRFLAHIVVAIACLLTLPGLNVGGLIIATLVLVWMTNLYNFMDGADGMAGGMAVIGFGALTVAAWLAGAPELALLCAAIAASTLAFLRFNFPPARLFMGDTGSIPLGFLAAALAVYGVLHGYWSILFPLMVFSPFIVDASVSLTKRGLRGEKIWHAHRDHYYQRLVRMGWSHRQLALAAYTLMLACAFIGMTLIMAPAFASLLVALWGIGLTLILLTIDWRWSHINHEL
ncbi:MAG: glycosyltransferase family 4 protein [Thiobacillaceae bacterium]